MEADDKKNPRCGSWSPPYVPYCPSKQTVCHNSPYRIGQRPTRMFDPENSRENYLHFFSLDHESSFRNSRPLLETWDFERKNLVLVSNPEICKTKILFCLKPRDLEKIILNLVLNHEIQRDKNLDLVSKNPYISMYSFNNNLETGSNVLTYSIHSRT